MRPDLAGEVQGVLAFLGMAIQFLRQYKSISDLWTVGGGAIGAILVWGLAADWMAAGQDWQAFALRSILAVAGCIGAVLGGIFGAAKLGNSGVVFPATNSKK